MRGKVLAIGLAVGLILSVVGTAAATDSPATPTRHLAAKGGTVTWTVSVKEATLCLWSASPRIPKFNASERCETGKITRSAKFQANTSTKAKGYTLTLTVRGETTRVDHLRVVEAGRSVAKTKVTTTTVTTTTVAKTKVTTTTVTTTTVPFTCSGDVTVSGTVSVTGGDPSYVTSVRGTLTNGRNVAISDVEISFVLVPTNGYAGMGETVVVDIPGSVARGAKVSWSGSGQPVPYPETFDQLWVSNYDNDATGLNCGVDGIGSN